MALNVNFDGEELRVLANSKESINLLHRIVALGTNCTGNSKENAELIAFADAIQAAAEERQPFFPALIEFTTYNSQNFPETFQRVVNRAEDMPVGQHFIVKKCNYHGDAKLYLDKASSALLNPPKAKHTVTVADVKATF